MKAKQVVVLEGNGRNSSVSPQNYDQTSSYSLKNYDQSSSVSLQNYDQGVQDFDFNGLFLLTGGSILKTKMEEMFVFKSSFIPNRVIVE